MLIDKKRCYLQFMNKNTHLHCVVGWWYIHSSPLLQTGQNLHLSITFCFLTGMASSSTISMSITSSVTEGCTQDMNKRLHLQKYNLLPNMCRIISHSKCRSIRRLSTFQWHDSSLQSVKDTHFGFSVHVNTATCDLWGWSDIIQLHVTLSEVLQWAWYSIQCHYELRACRVPHLLTNQKKKKKKSRAGEKTIKYMKKKTKSLTELRAYPYSPFILAKKIVKYTAAQLSCDVNFTLQTLYKRCEWGQWLNVKTDFPMV